MPEEFFDVCDEQDRVIGRESRREVHRRGLLHRAVHVWVFRPDGRVLLQRRDASKDEFPGAFTSSASGHVDAGETYDAAAVRELEEELQLRAPLERLVKLPASPETAHEHTVLYRCTTGQEPTPDPSEIDGVEWLTMESLSARVAEHSEQFTPPFRELLRWYRSADRA